MAEQKKKKRMNFVLHHPADNSGCGFYRLKAPAIVLESITKDISIINSMKLVPLQQFYQDIKCVRVQRQLGHQQTQFILDFLCKIRDATGQFIIVYEIDDDINPNHIPDYNSAKKAFLDTSLHDNVKRIFKEVDFITTTTEYLKASYVKHYNVEPEKIIVIPNYMPRWWAGETFSVERSMKLLTANKKRPRIGLPLSSSHFDLDGKAGYDDTTAIVPFIRNNYKRYEFCFIGHCPKGLEDIYKAGKLQVLSGSDIMNYPRELWRHNFQAIVAPLRDNEFNKAKSNIKLVEGWALGIPVITQDLECYNQYHNLVFKDNNQLQNQIDGLFGNPQKYKKIIKQNRHIVDYGDKNAPNGYWLEKNCQIYYQLYTQGQNTIKVDMTKLPKYSNKQQKEAIQDAGLDLSL